jgi:sulfide:quinone oxidoreductase
VPKRIVVLGGGTGGTLAANRLRRALPEREVELLVLDENDRHLYQPGLLFVPFGMARPARLVRSRSAQLSRGVEFRESTVEQVDLDANRVLLRDGSALHYDVLLVASGASLLPGGTEGLAGGWGDRVHTFYALEPASLLAAALARFEGGRLVVATIDMPIKCPVAPLEFCFLADWYFRRRALRRRVEISYVTPLDGAFTKPACNRELSGLLGEKGIEVVTEFATGEVDGAGGRLVSYDGREVPFELAVVVPLHGGASYVGRSAGLGDALGFVPADELTLQSKVAPNVFVIGDAADLRASKAGSVAHFEGESVVANIISYLRGEPLHARFDGHTNCFIESGFHKALLIDYGYEVEPVPGRFPGAVGLPLLKESRLHHLGKLAFEQLYWRVLLPGRDLPFVGSEMPRAGKKLASAGV